MIDRRTLIAAAGGAVVALPAVAKTGRITNKAPLATRFPKGFLWGAATAGHQVEGNNVNADSWLLENIKPSIFAEPSGDAANSFGLWPRDLQLVSGLGLNTYRFSLEWARIEPEPGQFSIAMLDHYKAMIEGCRRLGIAPMVTFNHFTTPQWFAARGGWKRTDSADLFARYCDRAARHLADGIGHATTLNEPNLATVLQEILPPGVLAGDTTMRAAAARAVGSNDFYAGFSFGSLPSDHVADHLLASHRAGRAAIKAVRGNLPVGVSLAIFDDQAVGASSLRDQKRAAYDGRWLEEAKNDDFVGVQNYERSRWTDTAKLPPPAGARLNAMGAEVYPPSLAGAVRYAHQASGVPVIVTEHGVGTDDDSLRQWLIPRALDELRGVIADGIPVHGYLHWSLVDNFEWVFGYKVHFGLHSLDRTSFKRTPKPSARTYADYVARHST